MTVRIGLIGAGGMGRAHVERIENELAGGKIVAVADINIDGAKAVAEPLGAKAYGSGAELIADPDVDAVLIATFGKVHAPDVAGNHARGLHRYYGGGAEGRKASGDRWLHAAF